MQKDAKLIGWDNDKLTDKNYKVWKEFPEMKLTIGLLKTKEGNNICVIEYKNNFYSETSFKRTFQNLSKEVEAEVDKMYLENSKIKK